MRHSSHLQPSMTSPQCSNAHSTATVRLRIPVAQAQHYDWDAIAPEAEQHYRCAINDNW